MVFTANNVPSLRTAVFRSSGIIDERDTQVIQSLLKALDQGVAHIQLGREKNQFNFVYARNVIDACVACAEAMVKRDEALKSGVETLKQDIIGGQAFFITNGEPMEFWDFARLVWRLVGDKTPLEK